MDNCKKTTKDKLNKVEKGEEVADTLMAMTDFAAEQLKKLQKQLKKNGHGIRIEVSPGGCAGFQYFIDFEKDPSERDIVLEEKGFKIFIDPVSADFLEGTTLDYEESLQASGFRFNNPNVTHSCNCGKSVC
jgi:iron-sulfur cluster assembly accessory protein